MIQKRLLDVLFKEIQLNATLVILKKNLTPSSTNTFTAVTVLLSRAAELLTMMMVLGTPAILL